MFNSQPQLTIKAEKNKAFYESCHIGTFNIESGNIADCLEHCLENCRCQSFQICQNTKCQLCSSHKQENSSLLHEKKDCIYAIDNCDELIRSCGGYLDRHREPGMYQVVDSVNGLYEVYCHFDSDHVAWTLVLSKDISISENALTWSGYRLSKPRMKSIKNNSIFLQFTCDYEKYLDLKISDYAQIDLRNIRTWSGDEKVDVLEFSGYTHHDTIGKGRGKIGEYDLNLCQIRLHQGTDWSLHVIFIDSKSAVNPAYTGNLFACTEDGFGFFGYYYYLRDCGKRFHRCVKNAHSTTQLLRCSFYDPPRIGHV
ncbi:Hypothetical predicted protein [Paramuricea clavata]|uniref:Uncharacterized protein n=1 Tax=Paramuricea clavata TaxID=317549 RepID=A0A6S7FWD3_PARCT|nr:Hypothetical predicted protein [Paramuricea clavata]